MALLPCPFCLSTDIHAFHHIKECVKCMGCNSIFLSDNAKEKWNNRPSQWISVKDRLPETIYGTSSDVLLMVAIPCWLNNPFVKEGFYIKQKNGRERWKSSNGIQFLKDEITHWMPLPSPPKENE